MPVSNATDSGAAELGLLLQPEFEVDLNRKLKRLLIRFPVDFRKPILGEPFRNRCVEHTGRPRFENAGDLTATVRAALLQTLGPTAQNALHDAQCDAVLSAYGDAFLALTEAVAAFDMTRESATKLAGAATGYAEAKAALDMQAGVVARTAINGPGRAGGSPSLQGVR